MRKDDTRKKVDKIYRQVNKIALKGKDHKSEYHRYVDGLVAKGDYGYFEICLSDKYGIEVSKYGAVSSVKSKTWNLILEQTDSSFIEKLRSLYKRERIYQQGQEIRSDDPSYSTVSLSGPYFSEELPSRGNHSETYRTKYTHSGTQSQISIYKSGNEIHMSISDAGAFSIGVAKVIWATFSSPVYMEYGVTQSSAMDLVVAKLREKKSGGITATSAIRLHDIHDYQTASSLIGKSLGERIDVSVRKLFGNLENAAYSMGISSEEMKNASDSFELEMFQIKKQVKSEFQSPYETSRISAISATGPGFSSGATFSTEIPLTHGGEYLISVRRRGSSGWAFPEMRYEELFYKVSVKKDNFLGTIKEVEDYRQDPQYYNIKNRYAAYLGMKKTYLEVHKNGYDDPVLVIYENHALSEESNLFARYKLAIQYLNS